MRHKLEFSLDERRAAPPVYLVDDAWQERLHELTETDYPCTRDSEFRSRWDALVDTLAMHPGQRSPHDADVVLARSIWCLVRDTRPEVIVETGVARGITSRLILDALQLNGKGHLWSVDLPPLRQSGPGFVASAVPIESRSRWTYLRGSSRRVLPNLLPSLDRVDLFVHDSLHTEKNMEFEFRAAWPALRPGGFLLSDDIQGNAAFASLADWAGDPPTLVAHHAEKNGLIGVARKPLDGRGPA